MTSLAKSVSESFTSPATVAVVTGAVRSTVDSSNCDSEGTLSLPAVSLALAVRVCVPAGTLKPKK